MRTLSKPSFYISAWHETKNHSSNKTLAFCKLDIWHIGRFHSYHLFYFIFFKCSYTEVSKSSVIKHTALCMCRPGEPL